MDFIEEEDDSEDEDSDDDERVFLPSVPNKTQEGLKRNLEGPFVWQIVEARDVSRARMNDERKANELDFDENEEDKEKSTNKRMLKVTATDGYSEIVILERLGWSSVERARARWERQLTPGTKVLVKDLNEATSGGSALGRTNEDVVFADTDANFQILGGQVQKLKEKFEKKMRMKAASRFTDDGFSLGDVGKAPKFQPFDDETWKQFEKERKVKEEELRKEREEAERKEKMEERRGKERRGKSWRGSDDAVARESARTTTTTTRTKKNKRKRRCNHRERNRGFLRKKEQSLVHRRHLLSHYLSPRRPNDKSNEARNQETRADRTTKRRITQTR